MTNDPNFAEVMRAPVDQEESAMLTSIYRLAVSEKNGEEALASLDGYLNRFDETEPIPTWMLRLAFWLPIQIADNTPERLEAQVELARLAITSGRTWTAIPFLHQVINRLPEFGVRVSDAYDLIAAGSEYPPQSFDAVGVAWNTLLGMQMPGPDIHMMELQTSHTGLPLSGIDWNSAAEEAREASNRIRALGEAAKASATEFESTKESSVGRLNQTLSALETKAKQAKLLVDTVSAEAVNAKFDQDAKENQKQAKKLYRWGVAILTIAAALTVGPIVLQYLDKGPDYSDASLLAAHTGATLVIAGIAGVFLSRARTSDRAQQRAKDLSTAMGTIILYADQIEDPAAKEQFMATMGQAVLMAYLQADQRGDDQTGVPAQSLLPLRSNSGAA